MQAARDNSSQAVAAECITVLIRLADFTIVDRYFVQ
jgi:hypothetical protein